MLEHWSDKYVGKTYELNQYDCGHLVVEILKNEFNIDLGLPERKSSNPFSLSKLITDHKHLLATKVDEPKDGDIVVMQMFGKLNHIGLYFTINDIPYVIHNIRNTKSVITTPVQTIERTGLKIEGYYHVE